MKLQVPATFHRFFYAGIDTRATIGEELIGFGIGRFYAGIYPKPTGFDLSVGITDQNGCL